MIGARERLIGDDEARSETPYWLDAVVQRSSSNGRRHDAQHAGPNEEPPNGSFQPTRFARG